MTAFLALAYLIGFVASWSMVAASGKSTDTAASIGAFTMVGGALLAVVVLL